MWGYVAFAAFFTFAALRGGAYLSVPGRARALLNVTPKAALAPLMTPGGPSSGWALEKFIWSGLHRAVGDRLLSGIVWTARLATILAFASWLSILFTIVAPR